MTSASLPAGPPTPTSAAPSGDPSGGGCRAGGTGARGPAGEVASVPPEIVRGLRSARDRAGLFFDVDGVLAPIAARPEQACVPSEVRAALGRLVGRYRSVAVVSGRSLDDAARMVALEGLVMVGDHGREVLDAAGATHRVAPADRRVLEDVGAGLASDETLSRLGVRVEVKRASLALHVRGAPDAARALDAAAAAAEAATAGSGLVHHRGRAVVDVKLPGADKGTAVAKLVEDHGLTAALYVGDDRTDVDAMRALRAFGGPAAGADRPRPRRPSGSPRGNGPERGPAPLAPLVLVGVRSEEMPVELAHAADFLIPIGGVLPLLEALGSSE